MERERERERVCFVCVCEQEREKKRMNYLSVWLQVFILSIVCGSNSMQSVFSAL